MLETEINMTAEERDALTEISRRTGRSQAELIREAIDLLIGQFQRENRSSLMQKGKGLWRDRQDLPDFELLRKEWDRI